MTGATSAGPEMAALCAFPWDFVDKGLDATLRRCRDLGLSHLFLAASYHAGYFFYPDNPRRRIHLLEDGVTYFRPRLDLYRETLLQPVAADMCDEVDWFERIGRRAAELGLALGAWTVCLHNTRLGLAHPACTVENALGDRYPHALCPSDPRVRAYVLAMVEDLIGRVPLDAIMLEATEYRGRRHGGDWVGGHHHERDGIVLAPLEQALLDLSFTPSDLAVAAAGGVDGEAVRRAVADHLRAYLAAYPDRPADLPATMAELEAAVPELVAYRASLARAVAELAEAIKAQVAGRGVRLIGGGGHYDWRLVGAYGQPPDGVVRVTRAAREIAAAGQKLLVGIRLGFNPPTAGAVHSQTQLVDCVTAARDAGADGVMFYNLAEAPDRYVSWIGPALARSRPAAGPTTVRLGLIGCGGIGGAYLLAARRVAGLAFAAVMDVDAEQARRRADQAGVARVHDSVAALLADPEVDGVVIAAPPDAHAALFQAALAAGKHVLVEKPLGIDLAEADAMVDLAMVGDRIVGVGLVHRYLPFQRVIRDLVRAGSLGRLRQIRVRTGGDIYRDARFVAPAHTRGGWLTDRAVAGGGILMSSAIHLFSVGSFLLDDPRLEEVRAVVRRLHARSYPGIEDDVTVVVQTSRDVELVVEDSWVRQAPFQLDLLGDGGHLRAAGESWAESVVLSGSLAGPVPDDYADLAGPDGFAVNAARFADRCRTLFEGLLTDFAASIRANSAAPDLPSLLHARNAQAAVAAAYDSEAARSAVAVRWRDPAR